MALTTELLTYLNRSTCLAGLGLAVSCSALQAQENVFRSASKRLPAADTVPPLGSAKEAFQKTDGRNAGNSSEVVTSLKPEQSPAQGAASDQTDDSKDTAGTRFTDPKDNSQVKNREPIVLPALSIPNTSIQGVGTGSTPEDLVVGRLPATIQLPYGADRYGFWVLDRKTWIAPVFCVQPVYFEETMLERHGQERFPYLQPLVSGATFFSNIAFLPYQSYLQRPLEERYSTGHYRLGSPAPCLRQRAPYDAGALRFQLLTTGTTVLTAQP